MKRLSRTAIGIATALAAAAATAQVTFYEHEQFNGRHFTTDRAVANFDTYGFNDRASSVVVRNDRWEVCQHADFTGRCVVLQPGEYPSLASLGLSDRLSSTRRLASAPRMESDRYAPPPARGISPSQVTLFDDAGFAGKSLTTADAVRNVRRAGLRDGQAESVVVRGARWDRWEACDERGFRGECVVLRRGQYPNTAALGLPGGVASVRMLNRDAEVSDSRPAPQPVIDYDYGRRPNERLYLADVRSVKAVLADAGQRCWIESAPATDQRGNVNVPGALLGAVIGGVLGHQVGGGTGRDVATGVGVVAGAAIGSNVGRDNNHTSSQSVQRCSPEVNQGRVEYYDVMYTFRGIEHRVQMATAPGATVTVNEFGEPRA